MKMLLIAMLSAILCIAAPIARANEDAAPLLQKGGCVACHSAEKKILGPAFKDVSARYKGKDMQAALIKKVKEGGSGAWGPMPMPPNAGKLSDDEFKVVVDWVLSL